MNKFRKASLSLALTLGMAATIVPNVEAAKYEIPQETKQQQQITKAEIIKFFEKHGYYASDLAKESNIYASVMLAQMALESGYGRSSLAQTPFNNFFGIKGSYNGNSVFKNTLEDDGTGQMSTILAEFKVYPTYKDSMIDNANTIKKSIYKGAWVSNTESYKDATKALQGVYATDTKYANKLNSIIETYNLTRFDLATAEDYEIKDNFITHIVVAGESLYRIGLKYGMTPNEIMKLNGLTGTNIKPNQKLQIVIKEIAYIPTVGYATRKAVNVKAGVNGATTRTIARKTIVKIEDSVKYNNVTWKKIAFSDKNGNHSGWVIDKDLMVFKY